MSSEGTAERLAEQARLEVAGRLLVGRAKRGEIGPIYERTALVDTCIGYLSKCMNIMLVGEHGTGKNAIVESIALRMAAGEIPEPRWLDIVETDPRKLVVGCLYVGNLENKLTLSWTTATNSRHSCSLTTRTCP